MIINPNKLRVFILDRTKSNLTNIPLTVRTVVQTVRLYELLSYELSGCGFKSRCSQLNSVDY